MTDKDNITLPREVVEKALRRAFYLGQNYWRDADSDSRAAHKRADKHLQDFDALCSDVLARTALAAEQPKHPGYVIGSHWLETAYSRICAGEAEADVLRDCGWERVDEALRRENERYRWLQENARVWPSDKAVWADNQIGAAALWIKESVDWTDDASIDAAIDAAMGEKR